MTSQLKDFVRSCDTCRTFDPQQQKEPLQSHDVIDQVWAKVGIDLFSFENGNFLVTVDYLTNYWEADNLRKDTAAGHVVYKLKQHFARYGIQQTVVSDNGPQLASKEFNKFLKYWGIHHETSSPYHPQGNGKAESAVKMIKSLMTKARHAGTDAWLSVLEYRNTPSQNLGSSPAQRMFCRSTRSRLPTKVSAMRQNPVDANELRKKVEKNQNQQQKSYNRGSRELQPLKSGQPVRIYLSGFWRQATVIRHADSSGCSYIVRLLSGSYFRRNRRDLRTSDLSEVTPSATTCQEEEEEENQHNRSSGKDKDQHRSNHDEENISDGDTNGD